MAVQAGKIKVSQKQGFFTNFRSKITPYIFVSPFFILFIAFSAFPIVYSLYLSFFSWNGIRAMQYIGFSNYNFVLTQDVQFWFSIRNTFIMLIISGIIQHILALFFAFILNEGLVRFKEFFRGVLFVPYITSTVAITLVFGVFLNTQYGLFNYVLGIIEASGMFDIGFDLSLPVEFLRREWFWLSTSLIIIWKWTGWNAIIYFAGLQALPSSVYDAARIDGASWYQVFTKITLPMLKPIIFFATSITIIYGMQLFDEPMMLAGFDEMQRNPPFFMTSAIYVYTYAFYFAKFGLACAASYVLCLIILFMYSIYQKLLQEKDEK